MKYKVGIERGYDGSYSAHLSHKNLSFGLRGDGASTREAVKDFLQTADDMRSYYAEAGKEFPEDLEFEFRYDVPSFLQFYAYAFTLAGLERITGVNQKQLGHYISGHRKPSEKTIRKIEERIHAFGQEIASVKFL